jgi:unsaturated chondroitin disaccharide hydrolase
VVQGLNDSSCWSRGQSWGILGFAEAYQATNNKDYLEIAKDLANFFISNSPEDCIPYWDFYASPNITPERDSSAAAIACLGMLKISKSCNIDKYKTYAIHILNSLIKNYLNPIDRDGILSHGCFHRPRNLGIDESLIWGDYYFLKALSELNKG